MCATAAEVVLGEDPSAGAVDHRIRFGTYSFDYLVRSGDAAWDELSRRLRALSADLFIVIADEGLPGEVTAPTMAQVAQAARSVLLTSPEGEGAKSFSTLDDLAGRALAEGATRRSCVIALGGGVAGNLAGLVAALLYRGIRFIHLPTTLLAMSDSVLSLKQAVNSQIGKNHLGTFYSPEFVLINLDFLKPLPKRERRAALCELVKNTLAIRPDRYAEVESLLNPAASYSEAEYRRFIELSVEAKVDVMANDAFEKHRALVLEYGHTVGHAIELVSGGAVSHGFAVGLGMLVAARISVELEELEPADEDAHLSLLLRAGAPTSIPASIDTDHVLALVRRDNKRGYLERAQGSHDMVLLGQLGRPLCSGGKPLTPVPEEAIGAGLDALATTAAQQPELAGSPAFAPA